MFTAREVIRWFVGRSLAGLSVTERDDFVEVLTACQAEGQDVFRTVQRLEPILLESRFTSPALDHWRRQFKDTERPAWLPVFDPRGGPEMRWEEILLIVESALGAWSSARTLQSLIESRALIEDMLVEVRGSVRDIECPVCEPHAGRSFDPRRLPDGGIPPFHPGCGCLLLPYREEWDR